jgi:metal-responsive CopG/Arc/MetJ family transcriptional regulator
MEVIMSQTLSIRIPEELRKELEEVSKLENKPVSEFVRDSLRKAILIHRFRKLRNTVLPFAETQGILTDEDVFKKLK